MNQYNLFVELERNDDLRKLVIDYKFNQARRDDSVGVINSNDFSGYQEWGETNWEKYAEDMSKVKQEILQYDKEIKDLETKLINGGVNINELEELAPSEYIGEYMDDLIRVFRSFKDLLQPILLESPQWAAGKQSQIDEYVMQLADQSVKILPLEHRDNILEVIMPPMGENTLKETSVEKQALITHIETSLNDSYRSHLIKGMQEESTLNAQSTKDDLKPSLRNATFLSASNDLKQDNGKGKKI